MGFRRRGGRDRLGGQMKGEFGRAYPDDTSFDQASLVNLLAVDEGAITAFIVSKPPAIGILDQDGVHA